MLRIFHSDFITLRLPYSIHPPLRYHPSSPVKTPIESCSYGQSIASLSPFYFSAFAFRRERGVDLQRGVDDVHFDGARLDVVDLHLGLRSRVARRRRRRRRRRQRRRRHLLQRRPVVQRRLLLLPVLVTTRVTRMLAGA